MSCPGSVAACKGIASVDSVYSQEGTFAHEIAAELLRNGGLASSTIGATNGQFTVDAEMAKHVQVYLDAVRAVYFAAPSDVELFTEVSVRLSSKVYGTADAVVVVMRGGVVVEVHVFDLKFGRGVYVTAENNSQLMIYALAFLDSRGYPPDAVERVGLHIVQPRYATASPHREAEVSAQDLVAFRAQVAQAELATEKPDAPLVAGDHCRFCPAKATCPALQSAAMATVADVFPLLDPTAKPVVPDVTQLSVDQLARVLHGAEVAEQWIAAVRDQALKRATAGEKIPGRKLVERFGHRKWVDEAQAAGVLHSLGVDPWAPRELCSPAQIEKKSKALKSVVSQLTSTPTIGIALVPESDRRPALAADSATLVKGAFQDFGVEP